MQMNRQRKGWRHGTDYYKELPRKVDRGGGKGREEKEELNGLADKK